MTKEREAEIRRRDEATRQLFIERPQLKHHVISEPALDRRDLLAEIDRLRQENADLWRTVQQMNEAYHALKGQLAKAREALRTIAAHGTPHWCGDTARQALKEPE